ncbi:hypothetical protein PAPHI01_0867 [Pancytospora philotis]|nr:hypothetical protein PAPHI01_0867 [Pancytospora philotis]
MELLSETYRVGKIYDKIYDTVPRGLFLGDGSQIAMDYHADLLKLAEGDSVQIKLYAEKPGSLVNKKTYLTYGTVCTIKEKEMEVSFGGLMMYYSGAVPESLVELSDVYASVLKL